MPGAAGPQNLPRAVGVRRAKEIILTGTPFSAQEAHDWGMVNRVLPLAELMPAVMETARAIAGNAPVGVRSAKAAIEKATELDRAAATISRSPSTAPPSAPRTGSRACAPSTRSASPCSGGGEAWSARSAFPSRPRHPREGGDLLRTARDPRLREGDEPRAGTRASPRMREFLRRAHQDPAFAAVARQGGRGLATRGRA